MREMLAQVGAIDSIARAGLMLAGGLLNRPYLENAKPAYYPAQT
jgi:hypothetical protein